MLLVFVHVIAGSAIAIFYFALAAFAQIRSLTYHKDWYLFVVLYFAGVLSLVYYFLYNSIPIFRPYETFHPSVVGALVIVGAITYLYNKKFPVNKSIRKRYPRSFFLNFNSQFIATKSADILFQEVIIVGIVLTLSTYFSVTTTFLVFGSLFFLSHYLLVLMQGKASIFHISGSFIASFVFPALIIFVPGGGYLTYALHFTGYSVARMLAPLFLKK